MSKQHKAGNSPLAIALIGMLAGAPGSAVAAGGSGAFAVSSIRYLPNGDTLIRVGGTHNNPDACAAADALVVTVDDRNRRHMLAAAVMAKTTKGRVNGWLNGCVVTGTTSYARTRTLIWGN